MHGVCNLRRVVGVFAARLRGRVRTTERAALWVLFELDAFGRGDQSLVQFTDVGVPVELVELHEGFGRNVIFLVRV